VPSCVNFLNFRDKMSFWRAAGLNYIQYSNIAARCVRQALKKELQVRSSNENKYVAIWTRFNSCLNKFKSALECWRSLFLYINLACLSVFLFGCLFVCLYPINVKTAEPIEPNIFCGTSRDHRKGLWMIKKNLKFFNFVKKK